MTIEKNEVIKASGAIQITHGKLTLVAQKLFNVLLAYAFPYLENAREFSIPVQKILQHFSYHTKNYDHLKEAGRLLNRTQAEYNYFDKDGEEWGVFTLLSGIKIKNGVCTYRYDEEMRNKLNNPAIYAKINLLIQNEFKSKYSLFLYELCVDYKNVRQTPLMPLEEFRAFLGLEKEEYLEFKKLNYFVIGKAIKEINKKTDLLINVEFKRTGRKVSEIKFSIKENPKIPDCFKQPPLPFTLDELKGNASLLEMVVSYGVSEKQAKQALIDYKIDQIQQALAVMDKSPEKIRNTGGFFKRSLEEGWTLEQFDPQAKRTEEKKKKRESEKSQKLQTEKQRYLGMRDEERFKVDRIVSYGHSRNVNCPICGLLEIT